MGIKVIIRSKLFEIFFDKFLMALLILIVGFVFNGLLERNKIIHELNQTNATKFIDTCDQIWREIYQVENSSNELVNESIIYFLHDNPQKLSFNEHPEYKDRVSKINEDYENLYKLISTNSFILGNSLTDYFITYSALQRQSYEAELTSNTDTNDKSRQNSQDLYEQLNHDLQKMRFTLLDAQSIAVKNYIY